MKATTALQGAGVSALVLFPFYRSMLDMPGDVRMHMPVSLASLTLPLIANLVLVAIIFTLLGTWLHSTSRWAGWKFFLPALVFASLAEIAHLARTGLVRTALWILVLAVILLLSFVLHWLWPKGEKILLQLAGAALIGLGFFCIFVLLKLLPLTLWHPAPNSTGNAVSATTVHNDRPRVVWILFDELSYQQTFGDRYPNLQLPNFDKLRESSTLFTDTQPIIDWTEDAVPSILLGQSIARVDYTSNNRLRVGRATGAMHAFDAALTPFARARHNGLTTGVVGWYNPYCSMLAPYLNQCYWTDVSPNPTGIAFWHSFLNPWIFYGKMFSHPLQMMLSRSYRQRLYDVLMEPATTEIIQETDNRMNAYLNLIPRADRMLAPFGPDFVFLHLPIPHPTALYNRKTGQFDTSGQGSYIDNLALADKTLGHLLAILERSPRWKNTSVIICGDHSWRVNLWAGRQYWTAEDQAASHGAVFDPRPMLMVHLAGQTTAETVNAPFPLLSVHTILSDLVEGKMPSYPDASLPPASASLRAGSPASHNKIAGLSGIR